MEIICGRGSKVSDFVRRAWARAGKAHVIDLLDAEPVQHVGHESLEAHVCGQNGKEGISDSLLCVAELAEVRRLTLDTSDILGPPEVIGSVVTSALASVVDEVLGDLAERATLLPEVDDDSDSTALSALDGLLDTEDEVRAAGALRNG